MDSMHKLLFTALLILVAAIDGVQCDAMITGTVFCNQCKDGQLSLFDYPLYGTNVSVFCPGSNGEITMRREDTTNWFGNFAIRIEGTPDMNGCYAQISSNQQGPNMGCGAIAEPAQPAPFCQRSSYPAPSPSPLKPPPHFFKFPPFNPVPIPVTLTKPPQSSTPPSPQSPPPLPLLPPFRFPPIPQLPPLPQLPPMPLFPFIEASPCSHENWTMPEYRCYWRMVNPDTKVAAVFGEVAERRYGTNMTLHEGLQGRGDPYRTLLREGITAFLNSYNSLQFPYNTIVAVRHTNWALIGSPQHVLLTALKFKRANSGSGNITCRFTHCT